MEDDGMNAAAHSTHTPEFMRFLNITSPDLHDHDNDSATALASAPASASATGTSTTATISTSNNTANVNVPARLLDINFDNLEAMLDSLHRAENEYHSVSDIGVESNPGSLSKVEFTPLLSPMIGVNPSSDQFTSFVNSTVDTTSIFQQPQQQQHQQTRRKASFSPLSSPVLEFHKYQDTQTLRQKREKQQDKETPEPANSYKKPKTPSTTPLMGPRDKEKRHSSIASNSSPCTFVFEPGTGTKHSQKETHSGFSTASFMDAFESELTLPPPPSTQAQAQASGPGPAFTVPTTRKQRNSVLLNPNHHKSATSSPVILPSSYPLPDESSSPLIKPGLSRSNSRHSSKSNTPVFKPMQQPHAYASAIGTNILSQPTPQQSQPITQLESQYEPDKKTSHKLAEQGRRNRMNVAIQELDKLIPETWKKDVTVPSKATTVELGCRYICYLLGELEKK